MPLWVMGLIVLAILGAVGTGVYKVKQWGANEVRAEWAEAVTVQREEELERSLRAATGLQQDRANRRTIIQERTVYVDRNIEKLVDSGMCLTPAGVSCVNGSIDGKGSVGCKPDGTVPATKPAG